MFFIQTNKGPDNIVDFSVLEQLRSSFMKTLQEALTLWESDWDMLRRMWSGFQLPGEHNAQRQTSTNLLLWFNIPRCHIYISSPLLPTLAPPTEALTLVSRGSRTLHQELRSKPLMVKDVVYKEHNPTFESRSFTNTSTKEKNPWTKHSYGFKDHSWQHNRKTASTEQLKKLLENKTQIFTM